MFLEYKKENKLKQNTKYYIWLIIRKLLVQKLLVVYTFETVFLSTLLQSAMHHAWLNKYKM